MANEIFISYSRRDLGFVRKLDQAFRDVGIDPWVDWEDIPPNADWRSEIALGIEGADSFIFVISPDSVISVECHKEIIHAVECNKRLFPIVCRNVAAEDVHPQMQSLNWIFFTEGKDFGTQFNVLIEAINTDLGYVRYHTTLLQRAVQWDKKGRDRSLDLKGSELKEAQNWLKTSVKKEPAPTPLHIQYINTSHRNEINRRRLFIAITSIVIVIISLAVIAAIQWQYAESQRQIADEQRQLAEENQRKAEQQRQLAVIQRQKAEEARRNEQAQREIADMRRREAEEQRRIAEDQKQIAKEQRNLAIQGQVQILNSRGDQFVQESDQLKALATFLNAGYQLTLTDQAPLRLRQMTLERLSSSLVAINETNRLKNHQSSVMDVALSADNERIVSVDWFGYLNIWTIDGTLVHVAPADSAPIFCSRVSPDGAAIVTGGKSGNISIFDENGYHLKTINAHLDWVLDIQYQPGTNNFYSSGADSTIKYWSASGELLAVYKTHHSPVVSMGLVPNGEYLLSVDWNGLIIKTNLRTHESIVLEKLGATITDLSMNPSNDYFAVSTTDHRIVIFDSTGVKTASFKGHDSKVNCITFDTSGDYIISGSNDRTIRIWEINGTPVQTLKGHTGAINTIDLSSDGRYLISGSRDKTIRIWNFAKIIENHISPDDSPFAGQKLNDLLNAGCEIMTNYLNTNPDVEDSEKKACARPH